MSAAKISLPLTPEMLLALEAGVKDALKGLLGDEDARDSVKPDQTFSDILIDLRLEIPTLTIGHDTDKTPTCSIPWRLVAALLIKRMGATRDGTTALLREVLTEALKANEDKAAAKALLEIPGMADAEALVADEITGKMDRVPVKKPVKAKGATLTVTGLMSAPAPVAVPPAV